MSALERWQSFLAQIEGRHGATRAEAEAAAGQFIASVAAGGDYLPLSHQLMAVRSRLQNLETMITETWHAKVDTAICDEHGLPARAGAFARGEAVRHALDDAREELEPRIFADLARQRFAHVLAASRAVACACGRVRDAPISFRAIALACACGARMPFEPGELMRSVAAVGTHALAQVAAVVEWRAMRAAERALHAIRPPCPLAVIQAYERSQIAYWRRYLATRAHFEPELARDPALEIRARMEQWYVMTAEYEQAWVAAGRPREIV
jgi:hypothetical protein